MEIVKKNQIIVILLLIMVDGFEGHEDMFSYDATKCLLLGNSVNAINWLEGVV